MTNVCQAAKQRHQDIRWLSSGKMIQKGGEKEKKKRKEEWNIETQKPEAHKGWKVRTPSGQKPLHAEYLTLSFHCNPRANLCNT